MALVRNRSYFVSEVDVVLRDKPRDSSDAKNHLIFGDWLQYLGEERGAWAKVRCRGDSGWLRKRSFSEDRALEINFVDIGQGDGCHIVTPDDDIILIDAGVGDNMFRFLNWRYNLRGRKVAGVDGVGAGASGVKAPMEVDHVVISHPDKDHYYGFRDLFESKKVKILNVYHNSAVERPIKAADKEADLKYYSSDFLGGYLVEGNDTYLWDVVTSNRQMHDLIKKHKTTRKLYLSTLREARKNNSDVKFTALTAKDEFLPGYEQKTPSGDGTTPEVIIRVLGPVTERKTQGNSRRDCLYRLGDAGVTKNGHSVILQLQIGKLKVMLGGDLNTESQDYLFQHYCNTDDVASELETQVLQLEAKGDTLSEEERQALAEARAKLDLLVTQGRKNFQVDITKACHHGSHHFSETFLKTLNSAVTVISSGDNESYAHPRPDALGSFGRYGRGVRPLIFSTELARSTKEFIRIYDYYDELKDFERRIAQATSERKKQSIRKEMEEKKDRTVAVYGMITLRTDGEKVVLAQKLEVASGEDKKWDIHKLAYNEHTASFEYELGAKGH